jgi:hypothetical protein
MPSIEIACIDLAEPKAPPRTSFAVAFEQGLQSHRSPRPRFQPDFDALAGCLYHIGNPGLSTDAGVFFAYEVLSEDSRDAHSFLEFGEAYRPSARILLKWLVDNSPAKEVLFTSDWQFGPEWTDGRDIFVTTAEDALLSKLEWAKLTESQRQLTDAAGIIAIQRDQLDTEYIETWTLHLGLQEFWQKAKQLAV